MWLTLNFKVKFNFKFKINLVLCLWDCPPDNLPLIEVRISKFESKMHLSTVKIPIGLGIVWNRSSVSFLISNQLLFAKFPSLIHLRRFIYIYWGHPHPTWLRTYTHSYACRQGPAMDRETIYLYIMVRPLEFSQPRLGNWHRIFVVRLLMRLSTLH